MQRAVQKGNSLLFAERGVTSLPQIGQIDMKKVIPRLIVTAIFLQAIERVDRELSAVGGSFAVSAERLDREAPRLAWNADAAFPAASVIKIGIALEVLCAIEEGSLDESQRLELREEDKVIGSGVLSALSPGLTPSVGDLLHLALSISDNTAANLLVDRVGEGAVNARLARIGLGTTRLSGKIFGGSGEQSPTTANELVALLGAIHRHEGVPRAACERLLVLLARTQTASTIGRGLPDARFATIARPVPPISLAYKTGSLQGIITEAGIVTTKSATYSIALLSKGSGDVRPNHDNIGRVLLGEVSRAVYESFGG